MPAGHASDGRPFFSQQEAESPAAGLISRLFSVQLGILLPFLERSLEVRHSAWDRDDACASHAAPTILFSIRCVAQSAEHRPVKPGKRVQLPPT